MFEASHTAGGVLVYGIPEFRLPKAIVQNEVDNLKALGVNRGNQHGHRQSASIDELFGGGLRGRVYGSGAGLPMFMSIPGENLKGVYSANEYLTRINLMKAYRAARHPQIEHAKSVPWWAAATWLWTPPAAPNGWARRRSPRALPPLRGEMPARAEEVDHAKEEGIEFELLTNPVKILGDGTGRVGGLECVRVAPTAPTRADDAPGWWRAQFTLEVDTVVMSPGTSPNP